MNYQSAAKGIKKLYLAEVLGIAAVIALIASLVYMAINNIDMNETGIAEKLQESGLLVPFFFFAVCSIILFLVNYIMTLAGLINGAHDEVNFRRALWAELTVIFLGAIILFVQNINPQAARWLNVASTAAQLIVTLLVIAGISKIAGDLGKQEVSVLCEKTQKWVIRAFALSVLFGIVLAAFFQTDAVMAIVFLAIALVLEIAAYVFYVRLLAKARMMQ